MREDRVTPAQRIADKMTPPYRLLALDGGGIRGAISIEVLAAIEMLLREELGRGEDFVLADYFDYIGGTSTGAIIATCLSLGMPVKRIRDFYHESGRAMFDKASLFRRLYYKFEDEKLAERIQQEIVADTTLGSDQLRTLLLLVMRNASTNSPWPLSNNPHALYNRRDRPGKPYSNLDLKLWQLVRASTAAPTFFPPEVIRVNAGVGPDGQTYEGKDYVFVDGGLTVFNNPAFQLFLMATVEPYNLTWTPGKDQMLLVSVGTGWDPGANANLTPDEMNLLYHAGSVPSALMAAAMHEQDFLCRVLGDCRHGGELDREIGDMIGKGAAGVPKQFTYVRYNVELSREGLNALGLDHIKPDDVQRLDSVDHLGELRQVGQAVASEVKREHFAGFLT
jgi:predicted acylesterase/phospholipase RssA